jgi:N-acetyl sugar amidotransferase|tara:strand:+ start:2361 stop:3500 length:1140 start_codon:yes stop_codon:yes gene_type:complete
LKICKKCIQPNTRPGIFFDENQICGACLWHEEKKSINWNQREIELSNIAEWAKKTSTDNYDCVIGVSGGKDSTKQAITAKEKLGLRCLLVNCEPEGITDIGSKNIENLKNLGFDVISLRSNPKVMKSLIKYDFLKWLNPVKATEFALWSSTYIISDKFNIPLIIQGENPGLTLGTRLTGVGTDSNCLNAEKLQTLSLGWEEYLSIDGINEKDLFLLHYDKKRLESKNVKGIWLNYYLKEWSNLESSNFSKNYGFKTRSLSTDPSSIGTYVSEGSNPGTYFQLDTDLTQVNQLLKFIKFGFGQCMDHACYDILEGILSRDEAINLVKRYDGKCSIEYIEKFCNYIDISVSEFWDITEKFRGPMWKKNNDGEWINSIQEIL